MNAIIIDDNVLAAKELKSQLENYADIKVPGTASNSFDGLALAERQRPDVIFLDVLMPGISGLDFLDRVPWIKEGRCRIVMYTAHDEFVLPSIRKRAFDVLLKPIDPKELNTIVNRLRTEPASATPDGTGEHRDNNMILLWTNSVDFRLVNKADIGIIQHDSDQRCWEAVVANHDRPLRMKRSIKAEMLTELDKQFVQVNQKFIINMNYLIEVVDGRCRFFPPFDKIDYVTVGRMYRRKLTERFFSL